MKAFIVDDFEGSRNTLKHMIRVYCPEIQVVGESASFENSVLEIQKQQVDILFLDINLGGSNTGFNVLDKLKGFKGNIVVVSAYEEYAYKAFQYGVGHYLLKPIDPGDLSAAIGKLTASHNNALPAVNVSSPKFTAKQNKIGIPNATGLELIDVDNIVYIEGDGSYSKITLIGGRMMRVSKNMKFVLSKLNGYEQFIRVQKSFIVNKNYIDGYEKQPKGVLRVNGIYEIPLSISYKKEVFEVLKLNFNEED